MSILIDKYQIQEVVEMFSDTWIEDLKADIPTDYSGPLLTWLGIAWVFRKSEEFKHLTQIIEQEGDDRFDEDIREGTPIPQPIIGT